MSDPYPLCSVHKNTRYFADLGCPLCELDTPPEEVKPTRNEVASQKEIARLTIENARLTEAVEREKDAYGAASDRITALENVNRELRADLAAQELHAAEMSGTIMVLQAELAEAQADLATAREEEREACLLAMPPMKPNPSSVSRTISEQTEVCGWNAALAEVDRAIRQRGTP